VAAARAVCPPPRQLNAHHASVRACLSRVRSLETICLLMCYKIKYKENFFLLRGNHEASPINRIYGFFDECASGLPACPRIRLQLSADTAQDAAQRLRLTPCRTTPHAV
jgi:hypothetical protein